MKKHSLQIDQLESKMKTFRPAITNNRPASGWIKSLRTALGMSLQQLANKLSITKQSIQEIEQREIKDTVSIKTLKDVAHAMDMHFVYGFVPKDGSLNELINRKAKELAQQIVLRTEQSMKLENQQNDPKRIKKAIEERIATIKEEMPKTLWN
ncbi:MAG: hypothetical protein RI965_583 [Bacteroidota bacterium]|jgi:predicted DNA-binding mobile mystery protein A